MEKHTESRSFAETNPLISALEHLVDNSNEATKIPGQVNGQLQYLVRNSLVVLTYQPTASYNKQVLHEWRALTPSTLRESMALVQDALNRSNLLSTEDYHRD